MSKNNPTNRLGIDLYKGKTTMNWVVVILSVFIGTISIIYTRNLVNELKDREEQQISLFAKTLEYTYSENITGDISFFVQEILIPNNLIPIILVSENGQPVDSKNIALDPTWSDTERRDFLLSEMELMREEHEPIAITHRNLEGEIYGYQYVYYKNSDLLTKLELYPYVQLSIIFIFGLFVFVAFSYSKSAEQNRVWIGLAKETAHQLGTPISSLIAWMEYLKADENFQQHDIVSELEKDIERLEMITNRFSNIGSVPVLTHQNIPLTVQNTVSYLKNRISKKVAIEIHARPVDLRARINKPLFDWVIENLSKNAVDSMGGIGKIDIYIKKGLDGRVIVDIADTGKGIPKSRIKDVFAPGYTTKTRGWGLGLTLVKRIIDIYHQGKIFVLHSEVDKGTTFRILLNSY